MLISALYFSLTPFGEVQSELIARTRPTLLDVMVAVFGGIALIVAKTQKGTVASAIFGVAIATALMPPLCTAGYGLAKGFSGDPKGFTYALGAMYLFAINTIFIALATFLVLKLLSFPMHKYANAAKRKRYATIAAAVGLVVMIPAIYTFVNVFNESRVKAEIKAFIENQIKTIPNYQLIDDEYDPETKVLSLNFKTLVGLKVQWFQTVACLVVTHMRISIIPEPKINALGMFIIVHIMKRLKLSLKLWCGMM